MKSTLTIRTIHHRFRSLNPKPNPHPCSPSRTQPIPVPQEDEKPPRPPFPAIQHQVELPPEDLLLEKLRSDLNRLPEHKGAEEYEDMPVESFAKALLAGYGWHEGRGVGRNTKEDVKVKINQKRSGSRMQGLGYSE